MATLITLLLLCTFPKYSFAVVTEAPVEAERSALIVEEIPISFEEEPTEVISEIIEEVAPIVAAAPIEEEIIVEAAPIIEEPAAPIVEEIIVEEAAAPVVEEEIIVEEAAAPVEEEIIVEEAAAPVEEATTVAAIEEAVQQEAGKTRRRFYRRRVYRPYRRQHHF